MGFVAAKLVGGAAADLAGVRERAEAALPAIGSVGTRAISGRTARVQGLTTTSRTFETLIALACPFDAIRVGFCMGQTSGVDAVTPNIVAGVAAVPSTLDADITTATPTPLLFGGSGTGTLPPSPALGRRTIQWSDWLGLPSVPRTDGGTLPLLCIRSNLYLSSGTGNVVMMGDSASSDSFTNWATKPDGRIFRLLSKGGGFSAGSWSGMSLANSVAANTGPAVIVQYVARGRVHNLVGFGDSITDGRSTYLGEGFGHPAAASLSSNTAGVAFEWSNFAWSGQNTTEMRVNISDAIASGIFDVGSWTAVLPNGSPNDVSTTITPAQISTMRGNIALARQLLATKRVDSLVWTWLPSNTAVKNYGSTDSLRTAYNDELRAWAGRGAVVPDFDAALAGVTSGNQVQMLAGSTSDNIHPNDTGNALLSPRLINGLKRLVGPMAGALITS